MTFTLDCKINKNLTYKYSGISKFCTQKCYRLQGLTTCAILPTNMRILKLLLKRRRKKTVGVTDFYQESIEKVGGDQIRKLVEKGLSIPVLIM